MIRCVVITGPTGAVGTGLIETCIQKGVIVYALVRPGSKRLWQLPRHPLLHVVSVDLEYLQEAEERIPCTCQVFYHFAWEGTYGDARNDMELQLKNIAHTLDAVRLAKKLGCQTFVGAGSQAEYGRVEGMLCPDTPAFPENGYGMAKLCAGQMSRGLCEELGLNHIWPRILSVYGPCDGSQSMIMSTIQKLLDGKKPSLTRGEQLWDYLYSLDAGKALYLLGKKGQHGKVYCLGSGKERPLSEYIEILRDTVAPGAVLGFGDIPYGARQVMRLCADISALNQDTGFVPEYSFADGIRDTYTWILKNQDKLRN